MRILLTGATGFVGNCIAEHLGLNNKYLLIAATRRKQKVATTSETVVIGDIDPYSQWHSALRDVDTVIHAASRVHIMQDSVDDPLAEYRETNVAGTLNLARQAVDAGVRRFIYISSIKVNGECTVPGHAYTADDEPSPTDPYAISKYEAETGLRKIASETGLEVVIIRPVLVYGPGVKANFLSMMRWLFRGIPLPLARIDNQRSLVAVDNLADLVETCIDHPAAANQTFLVSDDEDMSTTELLCRVGEALGKPPWLLPVPVSLLKTAAALIGKRDQAQRLLGSLQVDISKTKEVLNWVPPVSVDEGLKKTAVDFLARRQH